VLQFVISSECYFNLRFNSASTTAIGGEELVDQQQEMDTNLSGKNGK
jgi:hypothetical protein